MAARRRALSIIVLVFLVAGCLQSPGPEVDDEGNGTADPDDDGQGTGGGQGAFSFTRDWTPLDHHPVSFNGDHAYQLALEQLYEDVDALSGPRYRIPGTEHHAETTQWLIDELTASVGSSGGIVDTDSFTGEDYYELDLRSVASWTCGGGTASGRADDTDRVRSLTFTNVWAQTDPDHIGWVVAAHYDSKRTDGHGETPILAGDDGAGSTANVLELARALTADPIEGPVTFLLVDGEDGFEDCHPLAGSLHFAQVVLDGNPGLKATAHGVIVLDMVGNATATYMREGNSISYRTMDGETVRSRPLQDRVWDAAAEMGVTAFSDDGTCPVVDDHIPFLEIGLSSIDIIRYDCSGFASYWHTTADDHTSISPKGLDQTGAVVETALRMMAAGTE